MVRWSSHRFELIVKLQHVHIHAEFVNEYSILYVRIGSGWQLWCEWWSVCVWVGVGMCVCVTLCCMCETCLSKKDVGFHADMLCGVTNLFPLSQLTYCNKEHFLSVWISAPHAPPTRLSFSVPPRCGISPAGCATSSWKKQKSSKKEREEKWRRRRRRSGRHWRRRPDRTWPMLRR